MSNIAIRLTRALVKPWIGSRLDQSEREGDRRLGCNHSLQRQMCMGLIAGGAGKFPQRQIWASKMKSPEQYARCGSYLDTDNQSCLPFVSGFDLFCLRKKSKPKSICDTIFDIKYFLLAAFL